MFDTSNFTSFPDGRVKSMMFVIFSTSSVLRPLSPSNGLRTPSNFTSSGAMPLR
jgi:hypothetical protein